MLKRHIGFGLNIASLGLFVPGILMPMFVLNMELTAILGSGALTNSLVDKELSIMSTVSELWNDQRLLVAALIFAFSVCIPLVKTSLVSLAYIKKGTELEAKLLKFVASIGKWSMADVFVVAIFLAVLSTNHAETADSHTISVFGFKLALNVSTETLSAVGIGFYCFLGYCLVSLLGTHLACSGVQQVNATETSE